jgi:hypothetical protein
MVEAIQGVAVEMVDLLEDCLGQVGVVLLVLEVEGLQMDGKVGG